MASTPVAAERSLFAHPVVPTQVLVLRGITYVPHYIQPGRFVGPGGHVYLPGELKFAGALEDTQMLWPRAKPIHQPLQPEGATQ